MSLTDTAGNDAASALAGGDTEDAGPDGLHASFQAAFEAMGGAETLAAWALACPAQFYALLARLRSGAAADGAMFADVSEVPVPYEPLSVEAWAQRVRT